MLEGVGVGQTDIGGDAAAHDGEFALLLAVVHHHELGDIGPRPAGGRAENQRRQGPADQVRPGVFPDLAPIGDQDGNPLGGIHGTPAAEADDHIRLLGNVFAGTGFDFVVLGIGGHLVEIDKRQPGGEQTFHHLVDPAGLEQALVADQKNLLATQTAGARSDLIEQAPAENDFGDFKFAVLMSIFQNHEFTPPRF